MARKRTIDPDIWSDDKIQGLADVRAIVLYIGAISASDDFGRLEWSDRQLWARVFPNRPDVTLKLVVEWMTIIVDAGLVLLYDVGTKHYAQHPAWAKHQYVSRPSASRIPKPPQSVTDQCATFDRKATRQSPDSVPDESLSPPESIPEETGQSPASLRSESGHDSESARSLHEHCMDFARTPSTPLLVANADAIADANGIPLRGVALGDETGRVDADDSPPANTSASEPVVPEPRVKASRPPRGEGDPYLAAEWFFSAASKRDLIGNHHSATDDSRRRWILRESQSAKALLDANTSVEFKARSMRFITALAAGELNRAMPTVKSLLACWDVPIVARDPVPLRAVPPRPGSVVVNIAAEDRR